MSSTSWQTFPLGTLCTDIFDGPHATPTKTEEGPVYLGISNLVNGRLDLSSTDHLSEDDFVKWTRRVTPQVSDLVFSYETRLGEAALIPDGLRCCLGRRMGLMRFDTTKVDPQFMLYAYLAPEFQQTIQARTVHGSTVDRIPLIELPEFPITIPPLPTQRRIADILSALDDKIELNHQTNATLEAMAQAIFKEWFVDFNYPGATGELVDSELGLIPVWWRVGKLEEIATIVMGLSPPGDSYNLNGEGIPLINGPVEFGDYFPVKTKWTVEPTRMAERGDLIFCVRGSTTGRRVIADDSYCIGRGVCTIRAKNSAKVFLYQTINAGIEDLLTKTTGSVFPSLSAPDIKNFSIVVPPWSIIEEFQELTNPFISKIETNINQMAALSLLRDTLLPKLMSGKIEVQTFTWEN